MNWIILSLIASLLIALVAFIDKIVVSKEIHSPSLTATIGVFGSGIVFIVISLLFINTSSIFLLPTPQKLMAVFVGMVYTLAIYVYFFALYKGDITKFAPTLSSIPLIILLYVLILDPTAVTYYTILGTVLIVGGLMILTFHTSDRSNTSFPTIVLGLTTAALLALENILLESSVHSIGVWNTLFWIGVGCIGASLLAQIMRNDYRFPHTRTNLHALMAGGIAAMAGIFFAIAVSKSSVLLTSAFMEMYPFFILIGSYAIIKLRPTSMAIEYQPGRVANKIIATCLCVTGAILII